MDVFEFVVVIVSVSLVASIINTWLKQRAKTSRPDAETAGRLAKISELEERVKVLEKIVTDGKFDLRQQFHDLENS